jgi:hypothetical protein
MARAGRPRFCQLSQSRFDAISQSRIGQPRLRNESVHRDCESTPELASFKCLDEGLLEWTRDRRGESIQSPALRSWKSVAHTGEREDLIADSADHELGAPQLAALGTRTRV